MLIEVKTPEKRAKIGVHRNTGKCHLSPLAVPLKIVASKPGLFGLSQVRSEVVRQAHTR